MLSKTKITPETENCNCQKPSECPLNKKCLSSNIVYKAVVTSAGEGETKEYIGMTATTFKTRYRNHKKSFNYTRYEKDTALSKHIWELKRSRTRAIPSYGPFSSAPPHINLAEHAAISVLKRSYVSCKMVEGTC